MMRTAVFRLCGHDCGAPSGDWLQSCARINAPISPPPARKPVVDCTDCNAMRMLDWKRAQGTFRRRSAELCADEPRRVKAFFAAPECVLQTARHLGAHRAICAP